MTPLKIGRMDALRGALVQIPAERMYLPIEFENVGCGYSMKCVQ